MPQGKEVHKEYMRARRSQDKVHKDGSQSEGSQMPLGYRSKFLSYEEGIKVQLNVVNTLKGMSGWLDTEPRHRCEIQAFRGLNTGFTPNGGDLGELKKICR